MHLILVRHPKPLSEPGVCYGRLDLACEPHALETAVSHLQDLASGMRVFSSPLRRARDLAARLTPAPLLDDRLQELDFGDWEGQRWLDIDPAAVDAWSSGLPESSPPHGETLTAMGARCADWLSSFDHDGPPILAVTHAGPIRVIRATLEGVALTTYFTLAIPFAEPIRLPLD